MIRWSKQWQFSTRRQGRMVRHYRTGNTEAEARAKLPAEEQSISLDQYSQYWYVLEIVHQTEDGSEVTEPLATLQQGESDVWYFAMENNTCLPYWDLLKAVAIDIPGEVNPAWLPK